MLVPFNDGVVYMYRLVACLALSTVSLCYHMEANGDPSEIKSEISCANGSNDNLLYSIETSLSLVLGVF